MKNSQIPTSLEAIKTVKEKHLFGKLKAAEYHPRKPALLKNKTQDTSTTEEFPRTTLSDREYIT